MRLSAYLSAGLLLCQSVLMPLCIAYGANPPPQGEVLGMVVPSTISEKEPFTFSVTGSDTLEGEVVSVQTLEGEVVEKKKADKYGRVFLAAGLAAGAYLVSAGKGKGPGRIEVKPQNPPTSPPPSEEFKFIDPPKDCSVKQGLALQGENISPEASNLTLKIGDKEYPVLAATASELKTGPLPKAPTGDFKVGVTNKKTGQSAEIQSVLMYELSAKLGRQKIANSEATTLEFTFKPANRKAKVNIRILSGPVSFEGGAKEKRIEIENGSARVALLADPAGVGTFRVAYDYEGAAA